MRLPTAMIESSKSGFSPTARSGPIAVVLAAWRTGRQLLRAAGLLLMLLSSTNMALAKAEACPAYEQLRPLLNSERIQSCFGSYGVEVLEQQGNLRISSLYSLDGESRITRTLAISEFASDLPASLEIAYQAIRAGASMGATLESAGWRVEKRHRYLGEIAISPNFRCMSGLPENHPGTLLAVQVYDLWVVREQQEFRFALLAELHDPRYLTLKDLHSIYAGMVDQLNQPDKPTELMLKRASQVCAQL